MIFDTHYSGRRVPDETVKKQTQELMDILKLVKPLMIEEVVDYKEQIHKVA